MSKFSPASLVFASLFSLALSCAPNPAFAQHGGRGSHGGSHGGSSHGGGSHGGGHFHGGGGGHSSHAGGGFHGGSSHGSGHFHAGGGGHSSRSSGGFRSGGNSKIRNSRSAMSGGHSQKSAGSRVTAPNFNHSSRLSSSRVLEAHDSSAHYSGWRSFGNRSNSSAIAARGSSTFASDAQWHSFGNRGNSSFTAARGSLNSWQGGGERSWNAPSRQMPANNSGFSSFSRNAAPMWGSSRGFAGSDRRFAEPASRASGSAISASRVLANMERTRFGNSAARWPSFSNDRLGSNFSGFESPEFGGRHRFGGGGRFLRWRFLVRRRPIFDFARLARIRADDREFRHTWIRPGWLRRELTRVRLWQFRRLRRLWWFRLDDGPSLSLLGSRNDLLPGRELDLPPIKGRRLVT